MELEQIYKENMEFLKNYDSILFEKIDSCSLENIELITTEGMINIKYKENVIYPSNVDEAINNQVEEFYKEPQIFFDNPSKINVIKHAKLTSNTIINMLKHSPLIVKNKYWKDKYKKNNYTNTHKKINTIPFLILFGIGTGEYIIKIIKEKKIKNLVIVDTTFEFLKVSMHLINWKEIFTLVKGKKINLKIMIGNKTIANEILNFIYGYNPMYLHYSQFLMHINNPILESIKTHLVNQLGMLKFGWGFYEDERMSLNNTIMNLKNTKYIFEGVTDLDTPIVVVGAGPSLDNDVKSLKLISNKVIIISCGSALRTLWKNNITPDFHVEIERDIGTYKTLQLIDKKYLKTVTLLGLNVLHPRVKKLFKDFIIFFRANDAGTSSIDSYRKYINTNPTCVNGGFDLALSMNPKKIYLIGVDCGFKDPNVHHAEDNITRLENSKYFKKTLNVIENREFPGNFQGVFSSDNILLWSKNTLEKSLVSYIKKNSDVTVYNCSDGLRLNNMIPRVFQVNEFEKLKEKKSIKEFTTYTQDNIDKQLENNLNNAYNLLSDITELYKSSYYKKEIKDYDEALEFLDASYSLISKNIVNNQLVSSLLFGSMKMFYTSIYTHFLASESLKHIEIDFFNKSIKEIIVFLNSVKNQFKRIKDNTLSEKEIR